MSTISTISTTPDPYYLNVKDRASIGLDSTISCAYRELERQSNSDWGYYNGDFDYCKCEVHEHRLMKAIIDRDYPGRKMFSALEVGSGNFPWPAGLERFLQSQGLPDDVEVHIVGTRGESYWDDPVKKLSPQITLYLLGALKIEEIQECLPQRLNKHGFSIQKAGGFDICITSQCSRHTVDPTGLNGQEFNLVRKGGFFIGDGWYSGREGRPAITDRATYSTYVLEFLRDTRAPFLVRHLPIASQVLCDFILQKPDDTPIQLPLQYVYSTDAPTQPIQSKTITVFRRTVTEECLEINIPQDHRKLHGDNALFFFLSTQGCFMRSDWTLPVWDYLKPEDWQYAASLQEQLFSNDSEEVKSALLHGADVHTRSGFDQSTPLHFAVKNQIRETVALIVKEMHPHRLNSEDREGKTAMQYAVETGNLEIIRILLDTSTWISLSKDAATTLLSPAIDAMDLPFIQQLLEKGASILTEDAERVLQSAVTAQDLALIRMLLEKETALSEEDTERMMQYTVETLHRDELEFWRNLEIISILIKRGAPLSEENAQTVLAYAIERQDLEVINNLLMRGITPSSETALEIQSLLTELRYTQALRSLFGKQQFV